MVSWWRNLAAWWITWEAKNISPSKKPLQQAFQICQETIAGRSLRIWVVPKEERSDQQNLKVSQRLRSLKKWMKVVEEEVPYFRCHRTVPKYMMNRFLIIAEHTFRREIKTERHENIRERQNIVQQPPKKNESLKGRIGSQTHLRDQMGEVWWRITLKAEETEKEPSCAGFQIVRSKLAPKANEH